MISDGINLLAMIGFIKEGGPYMDAPILQWHSIFDDELIWITAIHSNFSWGIYPIPDGIR